MSTLVVSGQCTQPEGYAPYANDCDDADPSLNPGAAELCDGIDNDCDAEIDDGHQTTWYRDADEDGYGAGAGSEVEYRQ